MRLAMVGYFDLSKSFGLGDNVFRKSEVVPDLDISLIGIRNPLGQGVMLSLLNEAPETVALWRKAAAGQIARPEMEIGWSEGMRISREVFAGQLTEFISSAVLECCELTIYAVGTVFLRIEFKPGIPLIYIRGLMKCFEYAAYTPAVSQAIHQAALRRAQAALKQNPTGLEKLSLRKPPAIERDGRGFEESRLFNSFTFLILCFDEGDDRELPALLQEMELEGGPVAEYAYHGRLHYSWAGYLIEPRDLYDWKNNPEGDDFPPEVQTARILACIQIAHVFLGTCEAFERLFLNEIQEQADGYIRKTPGGRDPQELNRLRTLALAVVTLTNFNLVTPTDEDHVYFRLFDNNARIEARHELIQNQCDLLYNVQVAEMQIEENKRQSLLNKIVLLLTSLTLISVTSDAYNFIRDQEHLIGDRFARFRLLLEILLVISVLFMAVLYFMRPHKKNRRRKR